MGKIARLQTECLCCEGKGTVLDLEFNERPCSRCDVEGFARWAEDRRPKPSREIEISSAKSERQR